MRLLLTLGLIALPAIQTVGMNDLQEMLNGLEPARRAEMERRLANNLRQTLAQEANLQNELQGYLNTIPSGPRQAELIERVTTYFNNRTPNLRCQLTLDLLSKDIDLTDEERNRLTSGNGPTNCLCKYAENIFRRLHNAGIQ